MRYIEQGTSAYRKANFALFIGAFITFAILYNTQPLMPEFTREFQISPTVASLSLSVSTISLAVSMLIIGSLSEVYGRTRIMKASLFLASVLAVVTTFSPTFHHLLVLRVFQGVLLAGLPSVAMAYLGEEIEPRSVGLAMGLYISGNSIGGMGGRIITGVLTDWFDWRVAMGAIGALSLAASLMFWFMLPPSQQFQPRTPNVGKLLNSLIGHLRDPGMACLYGIGFLLMSGFVVFYNYTGFKLIAPPYSLSQTVVGWIFIVYIVGSFSSAWMGRLADKFGRSHVLGIALLIMFVGTCLTLTVNLPINIFGAAVFTFGFFGGHSIASSWVGRRAKHDKAQASSLYLFFYYAGSSIGGTVGGTVWSAFGWGGVAGLIVCFLVLASFILLLIPKLSPVSVS
jgi:MFS transporter, YNFM family, putative membrane transport protein